MFESGEILDYKNFNRYLAKSLYDIFPELSKKC